MMKEKETRLMREAAMCMVLRRARRMMRMGFWKVISRML